MINFESANNADYTMFGGAIPAVEKLNARKYSPQLCQRAALEWLAANPNEKDIVFRNFDWLLNIRLTAEVFKRIAANGKGFENIRQTIAKPSEIWGSWVNASKQKEVRLNWLLISEKGFYIVQTEAGFITGAELKPLSELDDYRYGVKFMR